MPIYRAPSRDTRFLLNELLDLGSFGHLDRFENATPDLAGAILEEAGRFAAEVLAPLNRVGDAEGCTRHADATVTTPAGFREAFDAFRAAGWGTLTAPAAFGGQALPHVLGSAVEEFFNSANQAFAMYPGLTNGAIAALLAKGSAEQQARYLPKMVAGAWTGTMNLTEPQCGTDLRLIRTRAVPQADGSYQLTGSKIFISAGEHDLAENIIHLVLAKAPGAPDSTKALSLFVVPKVLVEADGSMGERNAVSCGSIEEKMGIHGNATCTMNYDGATGWLVGEENNGLAAMFVMMNAARLGVGIQGLAQGEVAYQNGVAYAAERRQGRALKGPAEPQEKADPLFVHPDVRRLLMDAKALTEGLRALCLWTALQVDLAHAAPDPEERQLAADLVGLLTPVIKGYGTDVGYRIATDMQQVWGGHGYIVENGMEQFVRDARIAQIYEGANGIQALDLVGRKLAHDGGRAMQAFLAMLDQELAGAEGGAAPVAERLARAASELKAATGWLMQHGRADPDDLAAAAYPYMTLLGIVALGLMWLRMAKAAAAALAGGGAEDRSFYGAKLVTARHFAVALMPEAGALRRRIEGGSETLMALPIEGFAGG
jgi:alkylation response protein AidB-like acyl-CoA dehydrogenase